MSARVEPMSHPRDAWSPWAPVIWTALSLILFGASSLATFVVNWVVRAFVDIPHLVEMAEWSVLWGGFSLLGVLIAGRIAFGHVLRLSGAGLALAGIGIMLSAVVHVVLQQWAVTRFGQFDPDLTGPTVGLFAVLIGLPTAAFGVFVAPRGAAPWPFAFVLLGAAGTILILLGNVPGLGDGIERESWPLAIWLGISGLYAVAVTLTCVIRERNGAAVRER